MSVSSDDWFVSCNHIHVPPRPLRRRPSQGPPFSSPDSLLVCIAELKSKDASQPHLCRVRRHRHTLVSLQRAKISTESPHEACPACSCPRVVSAVPAPFLDCNSLCPPSPDLTRPVTLASFPSLVPPWACSVADVTEQVRGFTDAKQLRIKLDVNGNTFGGIDPAPGTKKALKVGHISHSTIAPCRHKVLLPWWRKDPSSHVQGSESLGTCAALHVA